jgi:glutamine amidotransferase
MCRWFAYISPTEECLIEDVLISPEHSLCKQVNENYLPDLITSSNDIDREEKEAIARNRYLNVDGFGIGYYNLTRQQFTPLQGKWPVVYKCAQPPLRDPNFRSLAANTATLTLFAHIRASSGTPVVTVNNHPFVFGRQMIMYTQFTYKRGSDR